MSDESKNEILFVSKDPNNQFSIKSLLLENFGEIQTADTRIRANQLTSSQKYDLIILDMEIPNVTGVNYCKSLKSNKKSQGIPVVIIGDDDDRGTNCINAFEAGADEFIQFPFLADVGLARIGRFLRKKSGGSGSSYLSVRVASGDLPGILQYLESDMKTGKLTIKHDDERVAVVVFNEGRLAHATAPYCKELDAITEVLSWEASHVTFDEIVLKEEEIKFDLEMTGIIMNCVVEVDEFKEIQQSLPENELMLGPSDKELDNSLELGQKKIYEFAVNGYPKDELLKLQKVPERKATMWLHNLIEEGYLKVYPPPFENYSQATYEAYKKLLIFAKTFPQLKEIVSNISFPLPEMASNLPFGAKDLLSAAPKIVIAGDNLDHLNLLVESMALISTAASKLKPIVKKHRKGVITTRLYFSEKVIIDIQQLPPAFDKLILNTLNEYISDLYGIIFLVSAQDKKCREENLRRLRILRQRFKGVNYFIVPRVLNQNNVCEFRMDCSNCGYTLAVDMKMAGSMGECPICKDSLTIPDALDHLAHTMHLPDDVPIAQIKPQVHNHVRDLINIVCESIIEALNPPKIVPKKVEREQPQVKLPTVAQNDTTVRERSNSPKTTIHAADMPEITPPSPISKNEIDSVFNEVFVESDNLSDTNFLDEILNADEDKFDIDDFIKTVKGN